MIIMRKIIQLTSAILLTVLIFNSCTKDKNVSQPYISAQSAIASSEVYENKIIYNVVYGNNKNWLGEYEDLDLDVYLPTPNRTQRKFPLVVYIHGGGFTTGDKAAGQTQCEYLATAGFTAVSINYRTGWSTPAEQSTATYRALQDAHAALRFLVDRADDFSIDTSLIFVQGASAGAVISLDMVYLPQDSADVYMRSPANKLGSLYTAGNDLTNTYTIKGIGSMWGALLSPYLITRKNAVPTIFYHGQKDNVVPWDEGNYYNNPIFPVAFGSKSLYDVLISYKVSSVAHIDPDGGHGVYDIYFRQSNFVCFVNGIITNKPQRGIYYTEVSNCE